MASPHVSAVLALTVCWCLLFWLLRHGRRLPLDHPNARSLHREPTPRIGGLGITAGILAAGICLADAALLPMLAAASALAIVSFVDDMRGLPASLRIITHFAAALGCLLAIGMNDYRLALCVPAVIWMTNLYNFMDGADGLAGGMAVMGFGALAFAAGIGHAPVLAAFCAAVAAAALAFLHFNFPPARLFMGDSGSIPLGFLAAMAAIHGWLQGLWSPLFPILVFSPFIVDASVTLVRRLLARERVWQAHRSHYYQRLIRLGWGHRKTALAEYGLMAAMLALGFLAERTEPYLPVALAVVVYGAIAVWVDRRWRGTCES